MDKNVLIIPILVAGALISCRSSPIQWIQELEYGPAEVHPIDIGAYGYPFITVTLNGKDYDLPWDTGNMGRLALVEPVSSSLNLQVVGLANSYDSEGDLEGSRRVYHIDSVKVFGQTWEKVRAVELIHPDLPGLIGPYFARQKRFTLDYRNKLIAVTGKPLPETVSGEQFSLIRSPVHELLIVIYTEINGLRVLTEIDTGKSRTVIAPRLAEELGLSGSRDGYTIGELTMGSHRFTVPSAKTKSFEGISQGLPGTIELGIGSDILSEVLLTVDYNSGLLLLQSH